MQETKPVASKLTQDSKNKALIAYVLGFVTGLIMLLTNPKDSFVKFHAIQSIGLSLISILLGIALSRLPFLWSLRSLLNMVVLVFFIIAAIKAYQGEKYLVPIVGEEIQKLGKSIKV